MLDLNDTKAIDYSSKIEFFPFEAYGNYLMSVISYTESGPAGSETNKGDKEYDLATVRVLESDNPSVPVDSTWAFFFQTGGNGLSVKARPHRAAELRSFHRAVLGKAPADKAFDGNKARSALLAEDLSSGEERVRLRCAKGNQREDGTHYRNDTWSAASATTEAAAE
jgi:hypothetical protein